MARAPRIKLEDGLELTTMSIRSLKAAHWNPRQISEEALEGLGESVKRYGFAGVVVYNARTKTVVGGHQRVKKAAALGRKQLPVIVGRWSEDEERELNVLLNSPTIQGAFTADVGKILASIRDRDPVGFSALRLDQLLSTVNVAPHTRTAITDPPPLPETTVTKLDDVWKLGRHRLACGSSANGDLVAALAGKNKVAAIWGDPPHGIDYGGGGETREDRPGKGRVNPSKTPSSTISGDTVDEIQATLPTVLANAGAIAKPLAAFYLAFSSAPRNLLFLLETVRDLGWSAKQSLIWVKDRLVISRWDYQPQHEFVLYGHLPGKGRHGRFGGVGWYGDAKQADIFELPKPARSDLHPTMKPVELVISHIENSTRVEEWVFDPYAGSGTTLMACEATGRNCLTIELEPAYCDTIVERWQTETGKKARR